MFLLLLLAACSSGTASQPASTSTMSPTPTPGITPTPTIPDVPSRLVHFLTSDHVQLAGQLYGHGKTIVICSHELHSTKVIWSLSGIAQRLATHGYQVLAYDFRGNGDSSGPYDLTKMDVDLRAAIAFARQQGATKIVLLGSSMGGTTTLKVAASEQVAAVITLSAPEASLTNVDAEVKAISAPKLFINSQNDDYAAETMHMYTLASPPKEIHMYPGGAHGTEIFYGDYGDDLTKRILNFVAHYAPVG
jgi:alpha/beta superfamily hydrolase